MKNQTTNRAPLTSEEKEQSIKDIAFRLNCMQSWDLYVFIKDKYKNDYSVYGTGQLLDPALEVSAIFGRHLLQFLRIKANNDRDKLIEYIPNTKKGFDDLTILSLYPETITLPLDDIITKNNAKPILDLIKIADKSVAHFTSTPATYDEQNNLLPARVAIYELILKYVPAVKNQVIRWEDREKYCDAILKW